MTPLLMKITAGEIIHVDAVGMFINILIVTILPFSIKAVTWLLIKAFLWLEFLPSFLYFAIFIILHL